MAPGDNHDESCHLVGGRGRGREAAEAAGHVDELARYQLRDLGPVAA